MLGYKARDFKQHVAISLEDLVPEDNFYRKVERSKYGVHALSGFALWLL